MTWLTGLYIREDHTGSSYEQFFKYTHHHSPGYGQKGSTLTAAVCIRLLWSPDDSWCCIQNLIPCMTLNEPLRQILVKLKILAPRNKLCPSSPRFSFWPVIDLADGLGDFAFLHHPEIMKLKTIWASYALTPLTFPRSSCWGFLSIAIWHVILNLCKNSP